MLDPKDIYNAILSEWRHRHDTVWKTRQIFITIVLAAIVIVPRIGKPNLGLSIGLLWCLMFATVVMIVVDLRYQRKKVRLLRQLYDLENHFNIEQKWRLGNSNETIGHFYLIYLILILSIVIAFIGPILVNSPIG